MNKTHSSFLIVDFKNHLCLFTTSIPLSMFQFSDRNRDRNQTPCALKRKKGLEKSTWSTLQPNSNSISTRLSPNGNFPMQRVKRHVCESKSDRQVCFESNLLPAPLFWRKWKKFFNKMRRASCLPDKHIHRYTWHDLPCSHSKIHSTASNEWTNASSAFVNSKWLSTDYHFRPCKLKR